MRRPRVSGAVTMPGMRAPSIFSLVSGPLPFLTAWLLFWVPPAALAEDLSIASGPLGGTYRDVYSPRFGDLMYGYKVLHRSTSGSGENLDLLAAGEVQIGFAQADVYASRLAADPDRFSSLVVIGRLSDECLYVAHRVDGRVKKLADLTGASSGRPLTVAAGPEGSGSRDTWGYLARIVPGLEGVGVEPGEGTLALNQLGAGAYDAVLWVTDATNFDHNSLRAVLANDALALMPLEDPALTRSLPDGTEVYGSKQVKLGSSWRAPKLATVCTSSLVFARKDADPALLRKAADAVALHLDQILPPKQR